MGTYWRWLLCAVFDVQSFETKSGVSRCNLMVCAVWEFRPGNDSGCFESMPEKEETLILWQLVNLNQGTDTLWYPNQDHSFTVLWLDIASQAAFVCKASWYFAELMGWYKQNIETDTRSYFLALPDLCQLCWDNSRYYLWWIPLLDFTCIYGYNFDCLCTTFTASRPLDTTHKYKLPC